ncbi:MAG: choice-of-anchor Q domain-containing protein, partial [Planctomycetota bacterium]
MLATVAVGNATDTVDAIPADLLSIASLIANPGADGSISLREAITAANNTPEPDTIAFEPTLSGRTITLASNLPTLTSGITIDGDTSGNNTADITINGAGIVDRVIGVAFAGTSVTLKGLTITGGNDTAGTGGAGVKAEADTSVVIAGSTITGNTTVGSGGGVRLDANTALTVTGSTIHGNTSGTTGGGIHSVAGTVNVTGSTISGNQSNGVGAGLYADTSSVVIDSSTITLNDSQGANGAGVTTFGSTTINNSIVAGNLGGGVANLAGQTGGSNFSGDFNLLGPGDGTGGTNNIFVANNDPQLGPLGNNGGPTRTHALLFGGPAIDAGNSSLTTDQRGAARPADNPTVANASGGNGSDIGAFESQELQSLVVTTAADVVDSADFVTSLREAIHFANSTPGENGIIFEPSLSGATITLTGGELTVTDTLQISAASLGGGITVDAEQNSRVLRASRDLTLSGLTLQNGRTADIIDGSPGAGILFTSGGTLTLIGSRVTGNTATGAGGGIYTPGGNVVLTDSTIDGNSASGGGGIAVRNGQVTVTRSTIKQNSSSRSAGGLFVRSVANRLTVTDSTISGNIADSLGGGVYTDTLNTLITNSTVSGNTSRSYGRGLFSVGPLSLESSTVFNNQASGEAGGLFQFDDALNLSNTIVAGNRGEGTPDLRLDPAQSNTIGFSLIGDNTGTTLTEAQTADADGNLIGSAVGAGVIDPRLAPLADNGGTTLTHALLFGSPAVDAANSPLASDQRGRLRPL